MIGETEISDFEVEGATIKFSQSALENVSTGENTLTIETTDSVYTCIGTVADYVINDAVDFMALQTAGQDSSESHFNYYALGNDICDVDGYCNTDAKLFRGTLDGRGYAVKNLVMSSNSHALFSQTGGTALIKDIAFIDVTYVTNHTCAILVNQNRGVISDVFVSGVSNGLSGLVNTNYGVIRNSLVNISYQGTNESFKARPVIANAQSDSKVENVYAITTYTGGLATNAVGGACYASIKDGLDALNFTVPENFSDNWSFNTYGNLMFGDEYAVKYCEEVEGSLKNGELFYFSKNTAEVVG